MNLTKKYIWDYDVKKLNLKNPKALKWYLERKIQYGDWKVIDKKTLKKYLPTLKINPHLKKILNNFIFKQASEMEKRSFSHFRAAKKTKAFIKNG